MRGRFDPWVGKISWRRKWQPTPVHLPEKSHGQRSQVGYNPWGRQESNTTEGANTKQQWGMRSPRLEEEREERRRVKKQGLNIQGRMEKEEPVKQPRRRSDLRWYHGSQRSRVPRRGWTVSTVSNAAGLTRDEDISDPGAALLVGGRSQRWSAEARQGAGRWGWQG